MSATYFIVHQFINGQFTMTSDPFNTLEGAQEFLKLLEELSVSDVLSYKVYQCSSYGESSHIRFGESQELEIEDEFDDEYDYVEDCQNMIADEVDEEDEPDLTEMTLREYGKGYLLECFEDDPHFGEKYFLGGFWNPKAEGWFFKADKVDMLESLGAFFEDDLEEECELCQEDAENFDIDFDDEVLEIDVSGMKLSKYGKGYVLRPDEDCDIYGEGYFLDGWWNNNAKGWFFKAESLDSLLEMGAFFKDRKSKGKTSSPDYDDDLSTMTYRKYGKGYLLKAKKGDDRRGIKYFLNGWWMPEQRGWFFKKEYKTELKALGARYKKAKV